MFQRSGRRPLKLPKNNKTKIYQESSIVCLPSYREGLPKSLLEAAAAGLPIVTTDVVGCREAIINNQTGLLVPCKEPEKLANAIQKLIDKVYLNKTAGTILSPGQKFIFSLETTQRLLQENSSNKISKNPSDNAMLADFLNIKSGETLLEQYLSTREQIRTIYRQFFQFDN